MNDEADRALEVGAVVAAITPLGWGRHSCLPDTNLSNYSAFPSPFVGLGLASGTSSQLVTESEGRFAAAENSTR
jgi:hypothetical protein